MQNRIQIKVDFEERRLDPDLDGFLGEETGSGLRWIPRKANWIQIKVGF